MTTLHSFPFSFNLPEPSFSASEQSWRIDYRYVLVCIRVCMCYDQNEPLVIVTQLKKGRNM